MPLDENGHEVPDPRPMQIPAGFKRPETLQEQVQRLIRGEMSRRAAEQGMETFEESEDFDIDDDAMDPRTPYEAIFDPVLGKEVTPQEMHERGHVYRERFLKAQAEYFAEQDRQAEIFRNPRRRAPAGEQSPAPAGQAGDAGPAGGAGAPKEPA